MLNYESDDNDGWNSEIGNRLDKIFARMKELLYCVEVVGANSIKNI